MCGGPRDADGAPAHVARTEDRRVRCRRSRTSWRPSGWTRSSPAVPGSCCWRTSAVRSSWTDVPDDEIRRVLERDGGGRMNVVFLFGPNLGALGRRDPDAVRLADAGGDHGGRAGARGRPRAYGARGSSPTMRAIWSVGCWRPPRTGVEAVVVNAGRAVALLLRAARRDRGVRPAGDRGAHVEHLRPRGVPPDLRHRAGVPRPRSVAWGPVAIISRWRRCRGSPPEEAGARRSPRTTGTSTRCS